MPADLAEIHEKIGNEISYLYTKWKQFKFLYFGDEQTRELMQYAADFYFTIQFEVSLDDFILRVSRLTDPAESFRDPDRPNLTLKRLAGMIPVGDDSLKNGVDRRIKEIDAKCKSFKQHRNKRIAHNDLKTMLKANPLPKIALDDGDIILSAFAGLLNEIEMFYDKNSQMYEYGIHGAGDASELIELIGDEKALRTYHDDREYGTAPRSEQTPLQNEQRCPKCRQTITGSNWQEDAEGLCSNCHKRHISVLAVILLLSTVAIIVTFSSPTSDFAKVSVTIVAVFAWWRVDRILGVPRVER